MNDYELFKFIYHNIPYVQLMGFIFIKIVGALFQKDY